MPPTSTMAETPKKPQAQGKPVSRQQPPDQQTAQPSPERPPSRRVAAHKLREQRQQRMVILVTSIALGLALVAVLGGLLYDRLWLPSRPVARVGDVTLSRSDYWQELRLGYTQQVIQNFQLLALFAGNPQFTQQFEGQSPQIDQQIAAIPNAPVDDAVVAGWQDRQVKLQGSTPLGIVVDPDEVQQTMVQELGFAFLPPASPPLDPAEEEPADESAPAPQPTDDPALSPTPLPPAVAAEQQDQIVAEIFRRYELELSAVGRSPELSPADFRAALDQQYTERVLNQQLQAYLVPEATFAFREEPDRVEARQILIGVTVPDGASPTEVEAAFAEKRPEVDALLAELQAGADFTSLVAAYSTDLGSREREGSLGRFDRNGLADTGVTYPPELVAQAFALDVGVISDPIRTEFGWHVLEVTFLEIPDPETQLREARTAALDAWVIEQREALGSTRVPPQTPTPTAEPALPVPTVVPDFQPGPPTALPTEVPLEPEELDEDAGEAPGALPTLTPVAP
ncbi:peptidylprolyl isomerase [Candidatus Chloroploca sp. M-50]|uniref:Peptidylprolyl isomerase n=1 Tax=Candidatus Chloroploca mongolica TaxID=2528176 RepID=A0ABS4DDA0_9CHLR|nr:peptidylprolyl isomerase [Candidatus Chloroploca mongolica]MBP1467417.1 peptidylprolyl isomerase [Candidatus Chloroploca mongolica]